MSAWIVHKECDLFVKCGRQTVHFRFQIMESESSSSSITGFLDGNGWRIPQTLHAVQLVRCRRRTSAAGRTGHNTNWEDTVEYFNRHERSTYHKTCVLKVDNLLAVTDDKQKAAAMQVCTGLKAQIMENRHTIKLTVENVIFCGCLGICLRGRPQGLWSANTVGRTDRQRWKLSRSSAMRSGDQDLANYLHIAGGNAKYVSPKMQNAIIAACNELLVAGLVEQINTAEGFAVLADETTDVAGLKQSSL